MKKQKAWETYEKVAAYLIEQMKAEFGLSEVEGKQDVEGVSGASWEIDGKAIREEDSGIVLIECRRYTTSKIKQEDVAAVAYRIKDIGAVGGILVTPIGLQDGARIIADKEGIITVKIYPESNIQEYVMRFLNKIFIGVHDVCQMQDSVHIKVIHADGSTEERFCG